MANLLDYLDWRGDLTLEQDPFNEVDNLILAELSFVNFQGIVPGPGEGKGVALSRAAAAFFRRPEHRPGELSMGVLVPDEIPLMLEKMAATPRFRDLALSGYTQHLDEKKGEQFAALTIDTGDGLYLSFRGTDDTLAGWREDFLMACRPEVPAQRRALEYLRTVAAAFPRRKLRPGGHSKGGNLAVYAATFAPAAVQRRIRAVYSNDGPGFFQDIFSLPQYVRLDGRVISIVPKSSVVGMLMEHEEDYTVVDSDQQGLMQHDGFSWQVRGNRFVRLGQVTRQGSVVNAEIRDWLRSIPMEKRENFADGLYQVLSASGAATLTDLKEDSLRAALAMVRAMKELDKETRDGLVRFVGLVFKGNLLMMLEDVQLQGESRRESAEKKKKTRRRSAGKEDRETASEKK